MTDKTFTGLCINFASTISDIELMTFGATFIPVALSIMGDGCGSLNMKKSMSRILETSHPVCLAPPSQHVLPFFSRADTSALVKYGHTILVLY